MNPAMQGFSGSLIKAGFVVLVIHDSIALQLQGMRSMVTLHKREAGSPEENSDYR
jgi:hypothetical protein